MGKITISSDFSLNSYTDAEVCVKAMELVEKITGNPFLKKHLSLLEAVKESIGKYSAALEKNKTGTADDFIVKNNWRTTLEDQLKDLTLCVQFTGSGDDMILNQGSNDQNKVSSTQKPLHKPENVTVLVGDTKGSVIVCCDVIDRAALYEVKYALVAADCQPDWIYKASIKNRIVIDGLTEGKEYVFQIAGVESNLLLLWSDEITLQVI